MKRRKQRFGDPRKWAPKAKHKGQTRMQRDLAARRNAMTHEEMLANPGFDMMGHVTLPENHDVEVLKEVPAMHTGLPGGEHAGERVQVGIAILHSDGTVGLRYDQDAPLWAMEEIQSYADKIGYSLGEGGFTNGTA